MADWICWRVFDALPYWMHGGRAVNYLRRRAGIYLYAGRETACDCQRCWGQK